MAWVPLVDSGLAYEFAENSSFGDVSAGLGSGSIVRAVGTYGRADWHIDTYTSPLRLRITALAYEQDGYNEQPAKFTWYDEDGIEHSQSNEASPPTSFAPGVFEATVGADESIYYFAARPDDGVETYSFLVEAWVDGPGPGPAPDNPQYVYEMEKGWSFDGNYIPHFLELNWFFGDNPFDYTSIQKIRVHGLTKGVVNLQVKMAGMQGDVSTDYISDYMEPQYIDLPFTPIKVQSDFVSVTNYVDYSDRGLALQMRFEGRNTALDKPEPAHVLQVLALQGSPQGNGKRSN